MQQRATKCGDTKAERGNYRGHLIGRMFLADSWAVVHSGLGGRLWKAGQWEQREGGSKLSCTGDGLGVFDTGVEGFVAAITFSRAAVRSTVQRSLSDCPFAAWSDDAITPIPPNPGASIRGTRGHRLHRLSRRDQGGLAERASAQSGSSASSISRKRYLVLLYYTILYYTILYSTIATANSPPGNFARCGTALARFDTRLHMCAVGGHSGLSPERLGG
jgi:hypothetical protein